MHFTTVKRNQHDPSKKKKKVLKHETPRPPKRNCIFLREVNIKKRESLLKDIHSFSCITYGTCI